jgi:acetyl-CoA acetyltransferase
MLAAGSANVMVAGGMESMTNAPHLTFARKGIKYGAAALYDHMALDGLYLVIGEEERKIRRDPIGTGSAILKKVFGGLR